MSLDIRTIPKLGTGDSDDMAMIVASQFNHLAAPIKSAEIMDRLRLVQNQAGIGGTFSFRDTVEGGPHYQFPVELKEIVGEVVQTLSSEVSEQLR